MIEALPWLHRIPAFASANGASLARAAALSEVRSYASEKPVVRSGDAQTHVLIVAQGGLHLYRQNREAKTQMLIAIVRAPATFGDAELYAKASWMVSARSTDDTVIVHMPNRAFDELISENGPVAAALYRETCARLLLAVQVMQVHGLQKVKHKILRLLWEMAPAVESSGARVVPHSQTELAKALGVNRKTIARNLQELEDEGVIRRSGSAVEILLPREALPLRPFTTGAPNAAWKLPDQTS
jgi:CRP-like cAMP-binding protein